MTDLESSHFKTPLLLGVVISLLLFTDNPLGLISASYAHFDHLPLYNGGGESQSRYNVYQALGSDYARPKEPTTIMFSVQDKDGNDAKNIVAMVEVYTNTGDRMMVFPWTQYETGDFEVPYTFPGIGTYQIVLSVADGQVFLHTIDPPRSVLSSNSDCDCSRSVFNTSISQGFGSLWSSLMAISIGGPIIIIGSILGLSYRRRRRQIASNPLSNSEVLQYAVMLSAIAGGIVHLSIYTMHASLRMEYSIFFIVAGIVQIAYGVMYTMITISGNPKASDKKRHQKNLAVNLFGFIGTAVLVGLYVYTVVMPAPLSPTNEPDAIESAGILAKALEVFLLIGLAYIMITEKQKIRDSIVM